MLEPPPSLPEESDLLVPPLSLADEDTDQSRERDQDEATRPPSSTVSSPEEYEDSPGGDRDGCVGRRGRLRWSPGTAAVVAGDDSVVVGMLGYGCNYRIPIIGGRDLDLHKLFVEVTSRGGINMILHERRWKEVTATFVLPPTATNTHHMWLAHTTSPCLTTMSRSTSLDLMARFLQSLQNPSAGPGFMQGTLRPPQELQALTFTPQPRKK